MCLKKSKQILDIQLVHVRLETMTLTEHRMNLAGGYVLQVEYYILPDRSCLF